MAERRMVAKSIIDSDSFIDLPNSARLLYYDLLIRADDDGFINSPKKIMRMTGASQDDLTILALKKFIIPFDNGVVVIKHWRIHNYIRKDTYKETNYKEQKALLSYDENNAYTIRGRIVDGSLTQDRIGKDIERLNIYLPLKDGTEYEITDEYLDSLKSTFSNKNVEDELKKMRSWLVSNPPKRKTKTGIKRFINGWLSRETKGYEEIMPKYEKTDWERILGK